MPTSTSTCAQARFPTTFVQPVSQPLFINPGRLIHAKCLPRNSSRFPCARRSATAAVIPASMSGVNGGIDYDIDLSTLPSALATRIQYIQQGADSPVELIAAATEIAAALPSHPQTLPVLVDMLGFNNPVAANIAIDALVEAGSAAIPTLLTGVAAFNYAVNAYALRALARIGCPSVLPVCRACAVKGPIPNVRRAACRALSALRYTNAADAGDAYGVLIALADGEPDWGVRYAAIVALETFATVHLLPGSAVRDAVRVVQAAGDGRCGVSAQEKPEDVQGGGGSGASLDAAVAARARVAHEAMTARFDSEVAAT